MEQTERGEVAGARRAPRAARAGIVLAVGLEISATGALAVAVATGHTVAQPLTFAALVLVLALSTNRDTLFPSELAATTEASVFVCAVVAFREDSPVLAPALLGLVSGWLDRHHWRARASVRMAFNSGKNAWAAGLAGGALAAVTSLFGEAAWSVAAGAVTAAAVFVVVDSGTLTALLVAVRRGTAVRRAIAEVARVDRCSPLFALAGAGVGLTAEAVSWWLALPLLVLVALASPGRCVGDRSRRSSSRVPRVIGVVTAVAACLLVTTIVGRWSGAPALTAALVAVVAVVVGCVSVRDPDRGALASSWVVVAAALVALPSGVAPAVGVAAAVAAVTVSAAYDGRHRAGRCAVATALAAVASVGAFAALGRLPRPAPDAVAALLVAGVGFLTVVVIAGPRRRALAATGVWAFPSLALVASAGIVTGAGVPAEVRAVLPSVLVAAGAVLAAGWGSPPWRWRTGSRPGPGRWRPGPVLLLVVVASLAAVAGALVLRGATGTWALLGAVAAADVAVAMVATGVRQWRWAPGPRAVSGALLAAAAVCITVGVPRAVDGGRGWLAVLLLVVPLAVVLVVARPIVAVVTAASVRRGRAPRAVVQPRATEGRR